MFDFTTNLTSLQGVLAGAVASMFALFLKIVFFGAAVQVAVMFLPRWLRPLAVLAALTLLVAFPGALSAAGDAILARVGLLPLAPAGASAGGLPYSGGLAPLQAQVQSQVQSQVEGTLASFTSWLTAQLGL